MENQINTNKSKLKTIVELISKNLDKNPWYTIYLTSCYFSSEAAIILINKLNNEVKIKEIKIYIDHRTAIANGKQELERVILSFKEIKITILAIETNSLFHSKGYAAISHATNDQIKMGCLVVGSSNLTGAGLTKSSGNIESLLETQDIELINQFENQLKNLRTLEISEIGKFHDPNSISFKYALIQEGMFIHKWADDLNRHLSIQYHLNRHGRAITSNETLKKLGFNIEAATISKRYFEMDYKPPHLENATSLAKNYGVETHLGYWVPKLALTELFTEKNFLKFKQELKKEINRKLSDITNRIMEDYSELVNKKIIEVDKNPAQLFEDKANNLMGNDTKLMRMFSKYEIFNMPYDISQDEEIEKLFSEIEELSKSRSRPNITQKSIKEAIFNLSISNFRYKILDHINKNSENHQKTHGIQIPN